MTGLFEEDSFWWENAGTALDENNNANKDERNKNEACETEEESAVFAPVPVPCTSVTETLGWTSWRENNAVALVRASIFSNSMIILFVR